MLQFFFMMNLNLAKKSQLRWCEKFVNFLPASDVFVRRTCPWVVAWRVGVSRAAASPPFPKWQPHVAAWAVASVVRIGDQAEQSSLCVNPSIGEVGSRECHLIWPKTFVPEKKNRFKKQSCLRKRRGFFYPAKLISLKMFLSSLQFFFASVLR